MYVRSSMCTVTQKMCLQNDCVVGREGNKLEDDGTYPGITLQYVSDYGILLLGMRIHIL